MRELGWFAAAAAIKPNMFLSTLVLQDKRRDYIMMSEEKRRIVIVINKSSGEY